MREERLSYELRISRGRTTIIRSLINSSRNYKIGVILLIISMVINIVLVLSIPSSTSQQFYFNTIEEFQKYVESPFSIFPDDMLTWSYDLILFTYKGTFHATYWVWIMLLFIGGSSILLNSQEETRKLALYYYSMNSMPVILGVIRIGFMIWFTRWEETINLTNSIRMVCFIILIPFALMIPVHIVARLTNKWIKGVPEIGHTMKKRNIGWRKLLIWSLLIVVSIGVSMIYLYVEKLVS